MGLEHWGCSQNPERSNMGPNFGPCSGALSLRKREIMGLEVRYWICDSHLAQEADEEISSEPA